MNIDPPPPPEVRMATQSPCSSVSTKSNTLATKSPPERSTPYTVSDGTSIDHAASSVTTARDSKRSSDLSASVANAKPPKSRKTALSNNLKAAVDLTDDDDVIGMDEVVIEGDDIDGTDWVLCQPTGTTSPWWTIMKKFHPLKHPGMKDKAACMLCFEAGNKSKGTISISGKSTTGLMRHMQNHHQKEYENIKSEAAKKKINTGIPTITSWASLSMKRIDL